MEETEHKERQREEIFSKAVRAGRRTYFFDVKSTKENDFYLTITESKKVFNDKEDAKFHFEKHKLFLYKEDFEKFAEGLNSVIDFIKTGNKIVPEIPAEAPVNNFSDVTFEDLKPESMGSEEEKIA